MGGASAVIETLDGMHARMLADERLAPYLEGVDTDVLAGKQHDFLGRVLGASECDGERLRSAHAGMVARGLSDEHFDLTLDYMRAAMEDAGVPPECVDEVAKVVESTRRDVLCSE